MLIKEANGAYNFKPFVYKNMHQIIECECTAKGHTWYPRITDLLNNHTGCSKCVFTKGSAQEKELLGYIKTLTDCAIIENTRELIAPYEIDIYIPELQLAFEFNGTYWHSDKVITKKHKFASAKEYHEYKTTECEKLGVKLIHIDELDWINNKQDILKSIKNLIINQNYY